MLGNKGTGREYRDGGCRGGHDQFKWEDVKADAYRESYLGHSIHAPVGRWQKGRDLLWYTKKDVGADGVNNTERLKRQAAEERRAEIAAIKEMEEDMLNQELGLASKKRSVTGQELDKQEIDTLLTRGSTSRSDNDVERISGLGASASRRVDQSGKMSLVDKEVAKRKRQEMESALRLGSNFDESKSNGLQRGAIRQIDDAEAKQEKKKMKKEKKKMKKERKKEKRKRKKENKRKGRFHSSESRGSASSSSES